jgi:hypothetical protein
MALCNHANRLAADYNLRKTRDAVMRIYITELRDAVTDMTEDLKRLVDINMAQYLPPSAYALL